MKLTLSSQLLFCLFCSSQAYSLTMLEAIKVSLQGNPKMVANNLRLEAQEERVKAARLGWVPSLSISGGQSLSQSDHGPSSQNRSVGISSSISLYDGGARKQNLIATESELMASRERNSSTSPMGGNTKASIAGQVVDAYVTIVNLSESLKLVQFNESTLKLFFASTAIETEKARIQQQLDSLKTQTTNLEFQLKQMARKFKNSSTIELPPISQLQTLDAAMKSLNIPKDSDEAFRIALEKNPDIRVSQKDLESAEARNKALKASQGPQVSASVGVSRGGGNSAGQFNYGTSKAVGINMSMNFGLGNRHSVSASDKNVAAAKNDLDGTIDDKKFSLENIYPNLENQMKVYGLHVEAQKLAQAKLQAVIAKIKAGQPFNMKDEALFSLDVYNGYANSTLQERIQILYTRYSIQQIVGTLFENLGINSDERAASGRSLE